MNPNSLVATPDDHVGIIGLGLLGGALAERALGAGLRVCGYDPDPARREQFSRTGGKVLLSAQDLAAQSRQIMLVLPDDTVTASVLNEIAGVLAAGSTIFDATTGDPAQAEAFARRLAGQEVTYVEMTVSGSSTQARRGEALLMVGGPPEALARHQPLLRALAARAVHTGPCGSASRMKLVTNLVLGLNRAALAEGLVFANALGLDRARTLEILRASAASSRIMDSKGNRMIEGDFEPEARLSQHLKDVRLIIASAGRAGQRLPMSEAHRQLLEFAEQLGLGSLDNSAVIRAIEAQTRNAPTPTP